MNEWMDGWVERMDGRVEPEHTRFPACLHDTTRRWIAVRDVKTLLSHLKELSLRRRREKGKSFSSDFAIALPSRLPHFVVFFVTRSLERELS